MTQQEYLKKLCMERAEIEKQLLGTTDERERSHYAGMLSAYDEILLDFPKKFDQPKPRFDPKLIRPDMIVLHNGYGYGHITNVIGVEDRAPFQYGITVQFEDSKVGTVASRMTFPEIVKELDDFEKIGPWSGDELRWY